MHTHTGTIVNTTADPAGDVAAIANLATAAGDVAAIANLATAAAAPAALDPETPLGVIVPAGARHEIIDLERLRAHPRRAKGTVDHATVDSFLEYLGRHATQRTTAWVDAIDGSAEAVIDDHLGAAESDGDAAEAASAGWGEHRARLRLVKTPEWLAWIAGQGLGDQQTFAEHVETYSAEFETPNAATMLEIATSFHASIGSTFQKATRLDSGAVSLTHVEEVTASAGATGQLEIPSEFSLVIRPFVGLDPYRVTARLRYRVSGGKLAIGYQLARPDDVVRAAIDDVRERIAEAVPRTYVGAARS